MEITRIAFLSAALALLPMAAYSQGKPAAKDALLYFVWPQDGATIKGAFWCRFGLRNMGVTHAGDDFANSGHHHLLVDVNEPLDPTIPFRRRSTRQQNMRIQNATDDRVVAAVSVAEEGMRVVVDHIHPRVVILGARDGWPCRAP